MSHHRMVRAALTLGFVLTPLHSGITAVVAQPQCAPLWAEDMTGFGLRYATALRLLDVGAGPALYAAGRVPNGDVQVSRQDPDGWHIIGLPLNSPQTPQPHVEDLTVFDDGDGPTLFALATRGSAFGVLLKLRPNGQWEVKGSTPGSLWTAAVYDDGAGPAIYIGGKFSEFNGASLQSLVRWRGRGHVWEQAGTFTSAGTVCVSALQVFDDGQGEALYAAGKFESVGSVAASGVARLGPNGWAPVGGGVHASSWERPFRAMASSADSLYLGGTIQNGAFIEQRVLRWDGTAWHNMGGSLYPTRPHSLVVTGHAGKEIVYVSVEAYAGGPTLYRLVNNDWVPVPGLTPQRQMLLAPVPGTVETIIAAGAFDAGPGGVPFAGIATWDGENWRGERIGFWSAQSNSYLSILMMKGIDAPGHRGLYVGGHLSGVDQVGSRNAIRWDGQQWHAFGANQGLHDLVVFDEGSGTGLYGATTDFVGRWTGTTWVPLGGTAPFRAKLLQVFDAGGGPQLYAAYSAYLGEASRLAKWEGGTWSTIGAVNDPRVIRAMAVYNDGAGEQLYVGGSFSSMQGSSASLLARWDGAAWSPVGSGLGPDELSVHDLLVFDDGSGEALFVAGSFWTAGGLPSAGVAKWNGTWESLGDGIALAATDEIRTLEAFDEGQGATLYAGGMVAGSIGNSLLYRWDGTAWHDVSGRSSGRANVLEAWDDGRGNSLWVGGNFSVLGLPRSRGPAVLARAVGCVPVDCYPNCDGSTMSPVLNVDDVACFINNFAAAQSLPPAQQELHYANCDGSTISPVLSIDDFICFINAFVAGCP